MLTLLLKFLCVHVRYVCMYVCMFQVNRTIMGGVFGISLRSSKKVLATAVYLHKKIFLEAL